MKKSMLTLMLLFGVTLFLHAQTAMNTPVSTTKMVHNAAFRWKDTLHNFGPIPQNNPVMHRFVFKNSGKAPLILSNVSPSCGCTVAEYTREAIKPGQKGFIQVTFNAASTGFFKKSIAVHSNASEQPFMLEIRGEVFTQPSVTAN
ncbi:MAG: DUF1573 domain-containing protein [Bacteroidia bacterium]|jgi:hypothetical protein